MTAVGHRLVHGGEKSTGSVVMDESVIQGIKDAASFDRSQPGSPDRSRRSSEIFPRLKTKTLLYLTPRSTRLCRKSLTSTPCLTTSQRARIRRYGAHGTSHFV
ncbi:hypothetical protein ACNKHV_14600 [Shigella flexneri]